MNPFVLPHILRTPHEILQELIARSKLDPQKGLVANIVSDPKIINSDSYPNYFFGINLYSGFNVLSNFNGTDIRDCILYVRSNPNLGSRQYIGWLGFHYINPKSELDNIEPNELIQLNLIRPIFKDAEDLVSIRVTSFEDSSKRRVDWITQTSDDKRTIQRYFGEEIPKGIQRDFGHLMPDSVFFR